MEWGIWIAAGSLLVGLGSWGTYVWFERRRPTPPTSITSVAAPSGNAVTGNQNIVVHTMNMHTVAPPPPEVEDEEQDEPVHHHVRDDPHVCDVGPYRVIPGSVEKIELDVTNGDVVTGKIEGDDRFDYDIVNERNYVLLRKGVEYSTPRSGEDETIFAVRWKVRGRGPWFLILSVPYKQNPRKVWVYLRRE